MGNVSCMVSGVTIGSGDMIYAIPLNINKPHDGNYSMADSNEMFTPATLPILCKYEDPCNLSVNDIQDPDQREHNDFLERKYNKSIEDILTIEGGCFKGMAYVHKEVFELMQVFLEDYSGEIGCNWDYEKSYEKFQKTIKQFIERSNNSILSYEKMLENDNDDEYMKLDIQKSIIEYKMALLKPIDEYEINNFEGFRRYPNIIETYYEYFKEGLLKELICSLYHFGANIGCVGKHWTPTVYGQQYGNTYMMKNLLELATKINNGKMKDQE